MLSHLNEIKLVIFPRIIQFVVINIVIVIGTTTLYADTANSSTVDLDKAFKDIACFTAKVTQKEIGDVYYLNAGNGLKGFTADSKEAALAQAICDVIISNRKASSKIVIHSVEPDDFESGQIQGHNLNE